MAIKLREGEVLDAQVVFHADYNELNKIVKDEIGKAMDNINERIEQYLISHIRAEGI